MKVEIITAHALFRYVERVLEVDLDDIRKRIADDLAAAPAGATYFETDDGVIYSIRDGVVKSVLTREHCAATAGTAVGS